jgi:hypothetical protein
MEEIQLDESIASSLPSLLSSNVKPLQTTITWTSIQCGAQREQSMNKTVLGRMSHDK